MAARRGHSSHSSHSHSTSTRLFTTLPRPTLTFTLPSLHDGLPIDCRLYHPVSLVASPDSPPWRKHAAIFAHPYAPLGGCYDDGVVDLVASTLLTQGFLVCTFNFRGAHGSAGKTSWTSKPERADYMSVAGFLIHYVHFLDPFRTLAEKSIETPPEETPSADNACEIHLQPPTPQPPVSPKPPVFLSGGYSYGAMITTQLPSLSAIASLFDSPEVGSYAAEIRARAQHLAETQNTRLSAERDAIINFQPTSPRRHVGLRVGGDEEGRSHREPRRSRSAEFEESIRQGVAELVAKTKKAVHLDKPTGSDGTNEPSSHSYEQHPSVLPLIPGRTAFQPAYLLVSPLQGVITNLATMSFPSLSSISGKAWGRLTAQRNEDAEPDPAPEEEAEAKLVQNPTLAIYGDNDIFVPVRKLRSWVARLEAVPGTRFRAHEVSSAGHFWAQGNVASILRDAVRTFASSLLEDAAG